MSAKRTGKGSSADQAARRLAKARKEHDRETQKKERERIVGVLQKKVDLMERLRGPVEYIEGHREAIRTIEGLK